MELNLKNAVLVSKLLCREKLKLGDVAVDCTMGNGNDTLFLREIVGPEGYVYSFDIQKEAIVNTEKKLKEGGLLNNVLLINDGHENIDKYIREKVKLIIFNLGYLPSGDHKVTTKVDTTLEAVKKSLDILSLGGVVIIVVYPGHEEGKKEGEILQEYISELNQKEFNAFQLDYKNQINNPPYLLVIEKNK